MKNRGLLIGLAAAAALHIFLGEAFIRAAAPTYDEPLHLAAGYSYWKTGRYTLNSHDHPPLSEMLAAAALLPFHLNLDTDSEAYRNNHQYPVAHAFLYENTADAEAMLNAGRRLSLWCWTALLMGILTLWALRIAGPPAAGAAGLLFALCPAFISNDSLVTTDAAGAAFYFAAFYFLFEASRKETPDARKNWLFAAAGAAAGAGLGSKFNTILLPPLALICAAFEARRSQPPDWSAFVRRAIIFLTTAAAVLILIYRIDQIGVYLEGLKTVFEKLDRGKPSYILGRHSYFGVWWFFPIALVMKTPLPILILASLGLFFSDSKRRRSALWTAVPAVVYFAAALTTKFQIGYRHILPVFPFLLLWAAAGASDLLNYPSPSASVKKAAKGVLAFLIIWLCASVLSFHPHYLSYFSEAAGKRSGVHNVLVDSNLDWGQGLKGLSQELERRGRPPLYLAYFGSADPAYYGIRYIPAGPQYDIPLTADAPNPATWENIYLAVSATNLQAVYLSDKDAYSWLKSRTPVWHRANSLFLYDLTGDWEGLSRLTRLLAGLGRGPDAANLGQIVYAAKTAPPSAIIRR